MEQQEKPYIAHLDGLRGGAALWVLVGHCMIWSGWYWWRLPDPKVAVDIFMVISGYLMLHNWRPGVRAFWLRRFFRIAPAYYLSFIAAALLAPWFLGGYAVLYQGPLIVKPLQIDPGRVHFTPANWFWHLSFLFGLVPRWSFSSMLPDWSISLEMQFYALFPALVALFRRWGPFWPSLALVIASVVVSRAVAHLPPLLPGSPPGYPEPSFLPLKLPLFVIGMLADGAVRKRSVGTVLGALALSACFAEWPVSIAVAILLLLGFEPGVRLSGILRRLLGGSVAAFLAEMSYCVYLFHGLFIALIGGWLFRQGWFLELPSKAHFLLLLAAVLPASYLLAMLLNRLVERPGIALGRRLIKVESSPARITQPPQAQRRRSVG